MKNLNIDKSKVLARHALGIQQNFEDYPTTEDFLYDLVRVLSEKDLLEKEWYVNEFWHDFLEIKTKERKTYQEFVLDLVEAGYVEEIKDQEKGKFKKFKLKHHLWMIEK